MCGARVHTNELPWFVHVCDFPIDGAARELTSRFSRVLLEGEGGKRREVEIFPLCGSRNDLHKFG